MKYKFIIIKSKYILLAFAAIILLPLLCLYSTKSAEVFNVNGREIPIYSVKRDDNKIAVTFDCAWNDNDIDSILDTLDNYNCKATFFIVGEWAEKYPESLKKIYERGHEIGNHSYSHKDYTKLSAEEIKTDLNKCDMAIRYATGYVPRIVRAPSGGYSDPLIELCDIRGTECIQWSVDGIDYGDADRDGIIKRSTSKTKSGDIILLHNGTKHTAEVLPDILNTLSGDFKFVTVSELIYKDGYIIDHTGCQIKKQEDL